MPASVVLPSPGGPANSRWSTAWPRSRAAPEHDLEVLLQPGLADELVEAPRPQRGLLGRLDRIGLGPQQLVAHAPLSRAHRAGSLSASRSRSSTAPSSGSWPTTVAHLVGRVAEAGERLAHLGPGACGAPALGVGEVEVGHVEAGLQLDQQPLRGALADARARA